MKKTIKIVLFLFILAALYTILMYGYIGFKMQPLNPIVPPSNITSWEQRPSVHMIHGVNTPQRAAAKDKYYSGMEIDINRYQGQLIVAHDEKYFAQAPTLDAIWASLKHPEEKTYWLDLKISLSQQDIDQIIATARKYNIHPRKLLFETAGGETAALLNKNGLPLLLQLPTGFDEDNGSTQQRITLNNQLEELIRQYHPFAIAASLGKYPYLQAYFPHYNKAIFSSTTVRPSLKKYFLSKAMFQDPKVLVFMQDEYTFLPF